MNNASLINAYDIATPSGFKSVELHHANLVSFPKPLDCLAFSAYKDQYVPIPNTLIGALNDTYQINCANLSQIPSIDLKSEFNVWLSKPVNEQIKRLACVELSQLFENQIDYGSSVNNLFTLFRVMDQLELPLKNIAMPVIGTGLQNFDPESIIPFIIEGAIKGLGKIEQLKKVYLVELSLNKIMLLDQAMNTYLKRSDQDINDIFATAYYGAVLEELEESIEGMLVVFQSDSLKELSLKLLSRNLRTFELGILSRRICEEIVDEIIGIDQIEKHNSLAQKISSLKDKGIASWIISYFHTIRVFGNFYAHRRTINNVFPTEHVEQDVIVLITSLNRIVGFYQNLNQMNDSI